MYKTYLKLEKDCPTYTDGPTDYEKIDEAKTISQNYCDTIAGYLYDHRDDILDSKVYLAQMLLDEIKYDMARMDNDNPELRDKYWDELKKKWGNKKDRIFWYLHYAGLIRGADADGNCIVAIKKLF